MKNHLYLLAVLAVILSMVMVGCATPATEVAPVEPATEVPTGGQSPATETPGAGSTPEDGKKYFSYKEQGVLIVTPAGYVVEPTDVSSLPAQQEEFPDLKVVFSFDLLYEDGNKVPDGEKTDVRVWVRWAADDASPEGETEAELPPRLVIFWKEDLGWQAVTDIEGHDVEYHPPDFRAWGGVALLHITKWGGDDPGIGWSD